MGLSGQKDSANTNYVKDELKQRLLEEWKCTTQNYLQKIITNMPNQLQHVIKQKSYSTRYWHLKNSYNIHVFFM